MIERKIYKSFDAIKGIAVFLVCVCGHYFQFSPGAYWSSGNLILGVNITNFFIHSGFNTYPAMELLLFISGFQMLYSYNRIIDNNQSFDEYIKSKILRLFPITILGTLIMFIGDLVYLNITNENWYGHIMSITNLFENVFNIQAWINNLHTLNEPLWYVSVYFFCLILLYPLSIFGRKIGINYWIMFIPIILGLYLSGKGYNYFLINDDMSRGYIGFFTGLLVAIMSSNIKKYNNRFNLFLICELIVFFVISFINKEAFFNIRGLDKVLLYISCVFIPFAILIDHNKKLDDLIGNKWLVKFGKASFCIYVMNFPFYLWTAIAEKVFNYSPRYEMWYTFWITATIQIIIGILVHVFYEKKISMLIKNWNKK